MIDPFANVRCPDCGWVHYRELDCPPELPRRMRDLLERPGHYLLKVEGRSA